MAASGLLEISAETITFVSGSKKNIFYGGSFMCEMYEKTFGERLAFLRTQKGVSARDMSLSIGQNPSYINSIENKKALPSMSGFFYICEFLEITPQEFFDAESQSPAELRALSAKLKRLPLKDMEHLSYIVDRLLP